MYEIKKYMHEFVFMALLNPQRGKEEPTQLKSGFVKIP
jgi:hypothetical protein